jgi:uncharacterized membrane protein YqiK
MDLGFGTYAVLMRQARQCASPCNPERNEVSLLQYLFDHAAIPLLVLALVVFLALYKWTFRLFGIVIVPDDSIGTMTKRFVLFGAHRELPPGRIVAVMGEAGLQADTLAPGMHCFLWPWQYTVELVKFTVVPDGHIGVIEACDGAPLPAGRVVAKHVDCDNFQDARAFLAHAGERGVQMSIVPPGSWRINTLLFTVHTEAMTVVEPGKIGVVEARDGAALSGGRIIGKQVGCDSFQDAQAFMKNGGQRGPQMSIVPQGKYRINPRLFKVSLANVLDVPDNKVGVVTTREGAPLTTGEIAGAEVPQHNLFQDPQTFVERGGTKGLQEQVLLSGRYFINPMFATVEIIDMTEVPIASVGVVVAFVGKPGQDVTGADFKHANMVRRGEKGVWVDVLDPGKYAINPYTHKVRVVPTANVVLNWATGKTEAHKLDANLSTITVRSADGFTFNLDVSQIIHIPRNDAPKVIARFGSMEALVTQVLEPTIGNYFRNAAQSSDVIDFLKKRTERQAEAKEAIARALKQYDVGAVETLIGDINPPADLMKTLTDRKLAEQEKVTYNTQMEAQGVKQKLEQATALAKTQAQVVDAERKVAMAEFNAQAAVKTADGAAQAKKINANADAEVIRVTGQAEAGKTLAVGQAEAAVIKLKIDSMESGNYAVVQVAQALASSGTRWVPDVLVNGGASGAEGGAGRSGGGGSLIDVLLAGLVKDHYGAASAAEAPQA